MNKNFMKSSVKALAVAVAALAFTSCSKDQFTERDALNLELSRLRAQRTIDSIKTLQDRTDRNALLRYQRALDSLDRENAGGRVFYTVNVISATSSAVSNGRVEESEGVTGATVTTSQYGRVVSATTQSGIATFELRSGEATVAIVGPAAVPHTSVDYTVNLTAPFSGFGVGSTASGNTVTMAPRNGTTVYVGNVIPLFQVSTDGGQMATIRGRAFIETDLTNDVEELATASNTAITAAGAVANIFVTAGINANSADFRSRYLSKVGAFSTSTGGTNNQQGTNSTGSGSTSTAGGLGAITKIFYGPAAPTGASGSAGAPVTRVAINAQGDYTLLVPAAVSGLPIIMKSDEIVANRTYFRSDALGLGTITTQRHLYGPNVVADQVDLGASIPRVTFQAFTTAATVTASYQAQQTATSFSTGAYNFAFSTNSTNTALSGGFYAVTPNATFAPTNTAGTGATLGNTGDANATTSIATSTTNPAFVNVGNVFAGTPASTTSIGLAVTGVELSAGGSGYTAAGGSNNDGAASFTRVDTLPVGNGFRVAGATGSQISSFIQVTDGGFGFVYPTPGTFAVGNIGTNTAVGGFAATTTTAGFTGTLPVVSFGNILAPATSPVAFVIPEPTVGTITSINVNNPGSGLSSIPQPVFTYGSVGALNATDASGTNNLFVQAGGGGIQFNTAYRLTAAAGTFGTDYNITATTITLTPTTIASRNALNQAFGSGYVFVPTLVAAAVGGTFPSVTPANFTTTVYTTATANSGGVIPQTATNGLPGTISRIDITAPGNYTAAGITAAQGSALPATFTSASGTITNISLQFVAPSVPNGSSRSANSLAALSFAGGSGLALDNYVITVPAPSVVRGGIAGATATNIFNAAVASGYPGNTTLITSTLVNPNFPISGALASNLLAGSPWIVAFNPPAGGSGNQAWGIPYIDNVNGVPTIAGVRIINAGTGYAATTTAIPMTLMPNPFRVAGASATGAQIALTAYGPANAANFFVDNNAFQVRAGSNLKSSLANAGNVGLELPANGATLTFTVTNAGGGYSAAPRVVIADGGLTFQQIATALNPTLTGTAAASTDVGPVVLAGSATAGAGASLQRVGATFTGGAANQGRITFAVGSDPAFLANPAVFVIDALSTGLTNAYNAAVAAGNPVGGPFNNPVITIGANGAVIGLGRAQAGADLTPLQISKLPDAFVNGAGWPAVGYHAPPVVTIAAPASGTTATAVIDPAGVETTTFIPGIVPIGTNGTNAVTGVTGVTAVTAVAATSGLASLNVTNGTAAAANLVIQTSNGAAAAATVAPVVASSTATIAAPTVAGTGILTTYTFSIPAGAQALITATGAAAAVTPAITVVALNGITQNSNTATIGTAGVAGVAGVTAVTAAPLAPGTLPGKIQAIRVVNGGSGYGRGNLFQRWFGNASNGPATGNTGGTVAGQNYIIWGAVGSTNATSALNNANAAGTAFDVMTGVTFIRDIHYGTGTRVD